jgi:hypothetical protein
VSGAESSGSALRAVELATDPRLLEGLRLCRGASGIESVQSFIWRASLAATANNGWACASIACAVITQPAGHTVWR